MSDAGGEQRRRLEPWLWATLAGLLYFASFPPLDLGSLAFVAVAPLLLALRGAGRGRAFLIAWFAGTLLSTTLVSGSIYEASTRYFGDGGAVLLLFALVIPQIHGALYFAAFGALASGWEKRSAPAALLLVPAAWTACEFARASIGFGTPWCLLGHSQFDRLWVVQIADLCGVFGASFVVAVVNTFLALAFDARGRGRSRQVLLAGALTAALLAGVWGYGERQLRRWSAPAGESLRVDLVQPDLPLHGRASLASLPANLRRLLELTAGVEGAPRADGSAPPPADLVVWPENAVGFSIAANPTLLTQATSGLPQGSRLLLGAPREVAIGDHVVFRNSAFLLDRAGDIVGTYDKLRLTPFAETSPWAQLPFLQRRFASADVYTPGDRLDLFELKGAHFGVLICYEGIYPDLARDVVRAGAEFLVNISNDDWFGEQAALTQHLRATLFRAVESRRFLVRATNSGITVVIDPRGAIIAEARAKEPATLRASLVAVKEMTPYSVFGDVFAWSCILVTAVFLVGRRVG